MTRLEQIENELEELYPMKQMAYMDARENQREDLWDVFRSYRDRWNKLLDERDHLKRRNNV